MPSRDDLEECLIMQSIDGRNICVRSTALSFKGRLGVLFAAVTIQFGSHLAKNVSALFPYYSADLRWDPPINSYHWGWFQSAVTLPSLLLPALGGILVDTRWGVKVGTLIFLSISCIGQFAFWLSSLWHCFVGVLIARAVFGLGQGCISSLTGTIAALYFPNQVMFSIGLTESFHALSVWLSKSSSGIVADYFGSYLYAVIYAWCWCLFSWLVGLIWYATSPSCKGELEGQTVEVLAEEMLNRAWQEKR